MSFILDALKKSESDRQRQNGPALFEVKVAPRRAGLPLWAIAIAALLGINLVIVMWMLLRHPAAHPDAATAAVTTPTPAAMAAPAAQPQAVPLPSPPVAAAVAPASASVTVPTPVANAAQAQGLPPAAAGTTAAGAAEVNAEDSAPAAEPAPMLGSHVRRGTADGVPLYQDAAVVPGTHIPQLRLDLHVYAPSPAERFAMINMKKLREGDLVDGARVESITPDGVILSYSGSRFLLPAQ
jgi:general secretion pathway protein B